MATGAKSFALFRLKCAGQYSVDWKARHAAARLPFTCASRDVHVH